MSIELSLIARVLNTGDFRTPIEFGIAEHDFLTPEGRGLWNYIATYNKTFGTSGSVLNPLFVQTQGFPAVQDAYPTLTTMALCVEVRKNRIIVNSREYATEFQEAITLDPTGALAVLADKLQKLQSLGVMGNTDISADRGLEDIYQDIMLKEQGVDLSVMPWPWDAIQEQTMGIQPDDYIVLYGRPKSMKTWVLCKLIAHAFMYDKPAVVYTKEMTWKNMYMRVASCILRVPYDNLRKGRLSPEEKVAFYELKENLKRWGGQNLHVLSARDAPPGGDTVQWVQSKVDKYKPKIGFIDGLYLMSDHSSRKGADHVRVMNISRAIRQMILETGVPFAATMQANRKAAGHSDANLDEIAYSDALSQDATIAIRVVADKTSPTISLLIGGSREFKLHGFRIGGIPSTDFDFKTILTEKEIEKAKAEDDRDAAGAADKKAAAKKKESVRQPDTTKGIMDQQLKSISSIS